MFSERGENILLLDGIMILPLIVDGQAVRAGITMDAFTILMGRAGLDPEEELVHGSDVFTVLKPMIEIHLQAKHMRQGGEQPLIIDISDLVLN